MTSIAEPPGKQVIDEAAVLGAVKALAFSTRAVVCDYLKTSGGGRLTAVRLIDAMVAEGRLVEDADRVLTIPPAAPPAEDTARDDIVDAMLAVRNGAEPDIKEAAPEMLAKFDRFAAANPGVYLVGHPLGSSPDGRGKRPLTAAWPKLVTTPRRTAEELRLWAEAEGWGLNLAVNQEMAVFDIDHKCALPAEAVERLRTSASLRYRTKRGWHFIFRVKPGQMEPISYAAPPLAEPCGNPECGNEAEQKKGWGEIYYHTPRNIAGPGSADKEFPEDLHVPTDAADTLSGVLAALLAPTDTAPEEPTEDGGGGKDSYVWLRDQIWKIVVEGERDADRIYQQMKQTRQQKDREARRPGTAATDLKRLIDGALEKITGQPPASSGGNKPPPPEGYNFDLGEMTINGQEVVETVSGYVVDWLTGRPITQRDFPWSEGYKQFRKFYARSARIPTPEFFEVMGREQIDKFLEDSPGITTLTAGPPDDEAEIMLGAPGSVAMLIGDPGSGKTHAAIKIAELFEGEVTWIATESPRDVLTRLRSLKNMDVEKVKVFPTPDAQGFRRICEDADQRNVGLVIIDTLAGIWEEETNDGWNDFIRRFAPLFSGRVVLLCHHPGHRFKDRGRGPSALGASMAFDYITKAKREDDYLVVEIRHREKSRESIRPPRGLVMRLDLFSPSPVWEVDGPPRKPAAEESETALIEAYEKAYARTATRKDGTKDLPTENAVGEMLHRLGHVTSLSAGRRAVTKVTRPSADGSPTLLETVDGAGYRQSAGLRLLETGDETAHI